MKFKLIFLLILSIFKKNITITDKNNSITVKNLLKLNEWGGDPSLVNWPN